MKNQIRNAQNEKLISHLNSNSSQSDERGGDKNTEFDDLTSQLTLTTATSKLTSMFKRKQQQDSNTMSQPVQQETFDDLSSMNQTVMTSFEQKANIANAEDFIDAYSNQSYWLMIFLENVIWRNPKQPPQSKIVYNTLIELYLQFLDFDRVEHHKEHQNDQQVVQFEHTNDAWDAQYANMYAEEDEQGEKAPPSGPCDYTIESVNPVADQSSYKEKILEVVENMDSNYDTEHVLVLVQSMGFKEGVLKMYERLGLHYDIVQYYMEQKDYENVIASCKKYGESDLNLWVQVLSYFANSEQEEFEEEIHNVLQKIEKDNLLPPLLVVQILSKHPKTKLGNIKEYLSNKLQQDQMMIKEDVDKIKDYQQGTRKMRKEVHALKTSAKIFQSTTCQRCNTQLDLPAVHFMCQHSFHARCLPDQDDCPQCAKQNRDILQHKKKYDENGPEQQEAFFKQLGKKNADGFSVVAEYFGRGIFNHNDLDNIDMDDDDL